jgi:hypothetical protein
MKFSYFDVYFEVIPKIDKRPFYYLYGRVSKEIGYGRQTISQIMNYL